MRGITVTSLTSEYRTELLGTDVRAPRFGWQLGSDRRGTVQEAYRLQVAEADGDYSAPLWDSGRVLADASIQIVYAGPALRSRTRYKARVQVRDNFGRESDWSDSVWWETAFFSPDEWQAQWITPAASAIDPQAAPAFLLAKRFAVRSGVVSARVYATAAGVYELYLNGEKVGDELLSPGWTSYRYRQQYQTYDVTSLLAAGGSNGIGAILGNGWYKGRLGWEANKVNHYGDRRALLLQLHVVYADGTEEVVGSDASWRAAEGPIRLSDIYDGETYDASMEQSGWSTAEFDDSAWSGTETIDLPVTQLKAQEHQPIRVTEVIKPKSLILTPRGETVLDMGQNMVGRIRLSLDVPAGTTITIRHAEVLDKDGNFYIGNLRTAKQTIVYTAAGIPGETYAPTFTFMGFQYLSFEGLPEGAADGLLTAVIGEVIHSDMMPTGEFDCSSDMVNRLQHNIRWGQRGNFVDLPTDCPQRDERLGWTGDAQVFVRTAAFNYDVASFFTKWLRDLKADQRPNGSVPFVIPNALSSSGLPPADEDIPTSAAWGDAAVICPWTIYLCYGDVRLLSEQYESMRAWVEYIRGQGKNEHLWNTGFHFGDWLGLDAKENSYIGATPRDLIATAYFAYSARLLRETAVVLGKAADVRAYGELYERIKAEFRREFLTPNGRLAAPTQTAHVLALVFGLVEGDAKKRIARELNQMVAENGHHLTTGFVGTPYLCFALSDNGYHATAVKLLMQETYPSWLYSVSKGATTIWEHWDGIKPDGSFWSDDMNSYNHYAYGAVGEWMYRCVAGLDMDEAQAAYKKVRIRPRFADGALTHARAALESPYGRIESGWKQEGGETVVRIAIPANATADVILEGISLAELQESGNAAAAADGVLTAADTEGGVLLTVGSGEYAFRYAVKEKAEEPVLA
ncbi:alpha-L-rhamnosidase [Paenibacillus sacheonensis]|uniref:alpha-L-rhamnosidase n=1 Tax=Paenibacillus sacheonensis TaxID=742054 RepID=A0A7X4YU31_9BACL|nr:alpha-L-rhamnosidase [Paenibacillus sacheonensis]MBM7568862.1 alpha-L-rhamnosidase [Paenibacillus sacheonensis]NBC72565.1 family 78 glycoside hydrolase catalytic domain [Paenibacillus sacheonensis]